MSNQKKREPHFTVVLLFKDSVGDLQTAEISQTMPSFDAANNYIPDPLPNVMRHAADVLEEKLADGKLSTRDIIGVSIALQV